MADSSPSPSPPLSSSQKENAKPIGAKMVDLNESQAELRTRLQGLKQDVQNWRLKLDTQVKTYKDEISELKKTLNVELDQLRYEFQELRTTLQQQQEDVTTSLRNLGMQDDASKDLKESENTKTEDGEKKVDEDEESGEVIKKDEDQRGPGLDNAKETEH